MHRMNFNDKHLVCIFLCPNRLNRVMKKWHLDQMGLLNHPKLLVEDYFEVRGDSLADSEKIGILEFLDMPLGVQIGQSYLCPINLHMTRLEYNCDNNYFLGADFDPETKTWHGRWNLLPKHFANKGGAKKFAELREIKRLEEEKLLQQDMGSL